MVTFALLRKEKSVVGLPQDWFGGFISNLKTEMSSDLI